MGKKSVKSGSVLGYLWMLIGLLLLAVAVIGHFNIAIAPLQENVGFLYEADKAVLRYIGMGLGGLLLLIGFWNKPRKKESK